MKSYLTGANGVSEAIKREKGVLYISRKEGRSGELAELAKNHGVSIRRVSDKELTLLAGNGHRGFALETHETSKKDLIRTLDELIADAEENTLVLLLDGITDPRNLGAILRAADQFAAAVVVPRRRSAGKDSDSVSRASAGAVEWVSCIEVPNMARACEELKQGGFWIWGADMSGNPAPSVNLKGRTALVMGREGEGLHRLIKERCDGLIRIPTGGRIDSLNVATAAGILMYEARRQQSFPYRGSV